MSRIAIIVISAALMVLGLLLVFRDSESQTADLIMGILVMWVGLQMVSVLSESREDEREEGDP